MIQIFCCNFKESVYIFCLKSFKIYVCNGVEPVHYSGLNFRFQETLISIQISSTCLIIHVVLESKLCRCFLVFGFFTNLIKAIAIEVSEALSLPSGFHSCFLLLFSCCGSLVTVYQRTPFLLGSPDHVQPDSTQSARSVSGRKMASASTYRYYCHSPDFS